MRVLWGGPGATSWPPWSLFYVLSDQLRPQTAQRRPTRRPCSADSMHHRLRLFNPGIFGMVFFFFFYLLVQGTDIHLRPELTALAYYVRVKLFALHR